MDQLKPCASNTTPFTPLSFLDRSATVYGDCPAVIYNDTVFTWTETRRRCLQLASSLISTFSISAGDVVSVIAPNVPAMYEVAFGVPMSGAVLNTINTRLDARTVGVLLRHSEAKVLLVDFQFLSLAKEAAASLSKPPTMVVIEDEYEAGGVGGGRLTYEELLRRGDPEFDWFRPASEWTPMVLNYTSGTTSAPKGVVHCHRGLFITAVASVIDWAVPIQPVYLWTLPMFHANGWCFPWGIAAMGGTNVCLRKFDAAAVYATISKHSVNHLCGAPVVLNMIANAPPSARRPLPPGGVKILTAGAPPPAAVLHRTESIGFHVSHGYGLTETAGLAVSCAWKGEWDKYPADEKARFKARQGVRTHCLTEMNVVDEKTGKTVARDGATLGEVVLRGGCIMLGYLKDREATAKAMKDGWFYTGDVGVLHPDGYLEIKDRSKDVIISGGENLSSVEVESVLYGHPEVNEAGVVARPDEYWGETPCAFVSLKEGGGTKPSEKELLEYCRGKLPHYMAPKTVVFLEELPKTSTGKIKKFVLREMAKKLGSSSSSPVPAKEGTGSGSGLVSRM